MRADDAKDPITMHVNPRRMRRWGITSRVVAEKYGVSEKAIKAFGLQRFMEMPEEAREIYAEQYRRHANKLRSHRQGLSQASPLPLSLCDHSDL